MMGRRGTFALALTGVWLSAGCNLLNGGDDEGSGGSSSDDSATDTTSTSSSETSSSTGGTGGVGQGGSGQGGEGGAVASQLQVFAGGDHTCALFADGSVKCWGRSQEGQLGLGDNNDRGNEEGEMGAALPFVDVGDKVATLSTGARHTCAILVNGNVKCWGYGAVGQLGLGDEVTRGNHPDEMGVNLPTLDLGLNLKAVSLAAGQNHTCATLSDGSLKCWGGNGDGQLGLGDNLNRQYPTAVPLGAGVTAKQVVVGIDFTCALLNDNSVKCWGYNFAGALGLGDTDSRGLNGQTVAQLPNVQLDATPVSLVAGGYHVCALLSGGTVKCWGRALSGQLGLGDAENRGDEPNEMGANLPLVDVGGVVVAMSAGEAHTCVRLDDGKAKCWGESHPNGQLGLGEFGNNRGDSPNEMGALLPVLNLDPTRQISAGFLHTCAVSDADTIKCWGANVAGQLGLGDNMNRDFLGSSYPTVELK